MVTWSLWLCRQREHRGSPCIQLRQYILQMSLCNLHLTKNFRASRALTHSLRYKYLSSISNSDPPSRSFNTMVYFICLLGRVKEERNGKGQGFKKAGTLVKVEVHSSTIYFILKITHSSPTTLFWKKEKKTTILVYICFQYTILYRDFHTYPFTSVFRRVHALVITLVSIQIKKRRVVLF